MIPILYSGTESAFSNNGLGFLSDAISCNVTEERNGAYELNMQYPISGIHFSDIALRSIILAKPNSTSQTQPFRVYRITKPINGVVEIYAEHISYDLSGIPVQPFTASSCADALAKLKTNAVTTCPFNFSTDKGTTGTMIVSSPSSIRSQLGGKAGSILDVYGGGEYEFDRYSVKLWNSRGLNRGVSIRYGKNLTDIKQEENCANVYTGVYPFWIDSETGAVTQLTQKIVNVPGTFNFSRILVLDLSVEWTSAPTQAQLLAKTQAYIEDNQIGVPSVNLDVSFAQLEQSDEYKGMALLERVSLCDTVNVFFEKLGVNATAKAIKVVYNVLLDRIESIELGDARRTNLTDSILAQETKIEEMPSVNDLSAMVEQLTSDILGADGGAVRLLDTNADGVPDTLYIADNPDPTLATKVWRFNYQGWAASKNGYNGPFTLGATLNSGIVADFITAGYLSADRIDAHSLAVSKLAGKVKNGNWELDFDTGSFSIGNISAANINTGTLSASNVKIEGDTYFYWDGANINIKNPNNAQQIIRIGKYDGTHYGMGFSSNGGATWENSMDFNGVIATSIGALEISADKITTGTLNVARIGKNSVTIEKLKGSLTAKATDISADSDAWGIDFEANDGAGSLKIGAINASSIKAGSISADRIAANTIAVSKLTGTISAKATDITADSDKWELNFAGDGSLKIGAINASSIKAGYISADRISANSIAVTKLTGSISKTDVTGGTAWTLNLTDGTFTIGAIDASHITAGTISADRISARSLSLEKLSASNAFDGVTKISNTGIEINHSSVGASAKTTIKADGLKMYNASGALIGGIYTPTGQSTAKAGFTSLYNPSYGNFSIQLERFWNGAESSYFYGLCLYRKNTKIGGLAVLDSDQASDVSLFGYNSDAISVNAVINVVQDWNGYEPGTYKPSSADMADEVWNGTQGSMHIYADGQDVIVSSPNDIYMVMHLNGRTQTLRMSDVYDLINP